MRQRPSPSTPVTREVSGAACQPGNMSRAARRVSEAKECARARRQTAGSHEEGPRACVWQVRAGRGARCRDCRWVPASTCARVHQRRALEGAPAETMSCEVSTAVNVISETEPTGAQHPSRPHRRVRVLGTSQICYGRAPMCSQVSCAMLPQARIEAAHTHRMCAVGVTQQPRRLGIDHPSSCAGVRALLYVVVDYIFRL